MARKGRVGVLLRTRLTTFAGRGNRCCGTSDFVAPRPSLQLIQQRRRHVFTQVTLKLFHRPEVLWHVEHPVSTILCSAKT
jgi:hypothetical protein